MTNTYWVLTIYQTLGTSLILTNIMSQQSYDLITTIISKWGKKAQKGKVTCPGVHS